MRIPNVARLVSPPPPHLLEEYCAAGVRDGDLGVDVGPGGLGHAARTWRGQHAMAANGTRRGHVHGVGIDTLDSAAMGVLRYVKVQSGPANGL